MMEKSQLQRSSPRPVTPHSIVVENLSTLEKQARILGYEDPAFLTLLQRTEALAAGLEPYLGQVTTAASSELSNLATDTSQRDWSALHAHGETSVQLEREMLSGHVEGQFLKLLVHATGAKRILEIGLFTGYSALAMAEALPSDGTLVACELDEYAAGVARYWFDTSSHGSKIRIELGPALLALEQFRDARSQFDLIFIDADKPRYTSYFDFILTNKLLSERGLICVDNTLMQGEPYLGSSKTLNGQAITEFNRTVADDPRVEQVLLPIRDGLTLIRRVAS